MQIVAAVATQSGAEVWASAVPRTCAALGVTEARDCRLIGGRVASTKHEHFQGLCKARAPVAQGVTEAHAWRPMPGG